MGNDGGTDNESGESGDNHEDDSSAFSVDSPYALLPLFSEAPKLDHRSAARRESVMKLAKVPPPKIGIAGVVALIRAVHERSLAHGFVLPESPVSRYKRRLSPASKRYF